MLEINKIYNENCLEGLKLLDDNSIDSIVTDPPYELGFMGKKWDNTGIAYNIELWQECLRVLKHGGHLLSFGGTRTYHRMVCAIEDAGFEIRDTIQWIYGSGFPKSMDISKSIDKKFGAEREVVGFGKGVGKQNPEWNGTAQGRKENSLKPEYNITKPSTEQAKQYEGWGTATKPAHEDIVVAVKPITIDYIFNESLEELIKCLRLFALIAEKNFMLNLQDLDVELNIVQWNVEENVNIQENFKEVMDIFQSEIQKENIDLNMILSWKTILEETYTLMNKYTIETMLEMIIELKTLNYLQFQNILKNIIKEKMKQNGYNADVLIAIKNLIEKLKKLNDILILFVQENAIVKEKIKGCANNEPIVVARKPLSEKTVADNVLKWGTGGINIDDCRIEHNEPIIKTNRTKPKFNGQDYNNGKIYEHKENFEHLASANPEGRFPANVIFDEDAGKMLDEQSGITKSIKGKPRTADIKNTTKLNNSHETQVNCEYSDSGGASRFFKNINYNKDEKICQKLQSYVKHVIKNLLVINQIIENITLIYTLNNTEVGEKDYQQINRFKYCAKSSKSERGEGNSHPTVKPIKLIEYLITLVTPQNGICLDPFEGSGTHALACKNLGFDYIGFEKEEDYFEIIETRIKNHKVKI